MNEIEKLYENAGVGKQKYYACKKPDYSDAFEEKLPPFTAEKLINLVMFLINKGDFNIKKGSVDITFENFTNCIAGLINKLWQDLTEEERKQIRSILNGN